MRFKQFLQENVQLNKVDSPSQLKGITDVVDVVRHVDLYDKKLTSLPAKFGKVDGDFYCHGNYLTSLKGCPTKVGGNFSCGDNHLTSLKGCPSEVGGYFSCSNNRLTSLVGIHKLIKNIGGSFMCRDNHLTSLEGCPTSVVRNFDCSNNQLTSLEGCPTEVRSFYCGNNQLTSLVGIHKLIKKIDGGVIHINKNPIKEGGIGLLLIDGLKEVQSDNPALKIINKYLSQGKMGILACQEELIEAGHEDFAKL